MGRLVLQLLRKALRFVDVFTHNNQLGFLVIIFNHPAREPHPNSVAILMQMANLPAVDSAGTIETTG